MGEVKAMTGKMKLYLGLLVLGLAMVAGGLWFVFNSSTVGTLEITVTPSPGSYLSNSQNVSSEVLLKDVQVTREVSDKPYALPWSSALPKAGEPILVVSGSIQNNHKQNKEIAMYAEGYDATGKQVSWTLDAAPFLGCIGLHLENDETGQFTLHLNMADNIKSIRIFANNYSITPP